MTSFILGFIGLLASFAILIFIIGFPKKPKTNRTILLSIATFFLSLALFFIITSVTQIPPLDVPIWEAIVFTLMLTPFLEELIYRRIILQYFLNFEEFKFEYLKKSFFVGLVLIVPTLIFYSVGLAYENHKIFWILIPFFTIFPSILTLVYKRKNKLGKIFYYLMILICQAFIFTMMHGDYAVTTLVVVGLFYGSLYMTTKRFVPSLVAHYTINLLIFFKQMAII